MACLRCCCFSQWRDAFDTCAPCFGVFVARRFDCGMLIIVIKLLFIAWVCVCMCWCVYMWYYVWILWIWLCLCVLSKLQSLSTTNPCRTARRAESMTSWRVHSYAGLFTAVGRCRDARLLNFTQLNNKMYTQAATATRESNTAPLFVTSSYCASACKSSICWSCHVAAAGRQTVDGRARLLYLCFINGFLTCPSWFCVL